VFDTSSVEPFYVKYILRYAAEHPSEETRIASLGAGNGDLEVRIARQLKESGLDRFRFQCLDINPAMLSRGREAAQKEQIAEYFEFLETDLAEWRAAEPIGVAMAHHSLHHIEALEKVFAAVKSSLSEDGYFLTWDMIGRNGHMRWPEALEVVREIWRSMPDRYKYNHQTRRFEKRYQNWDCSVEGFEGIRAQDILPLLTRLFHFEGFAGFGNIPDVFIDRGFGHNLSPSNVEDVAFVRRLGHLNDKLIDEGSIKPTQMVAVMRARPTEACAHYRHWTPEYCVRWP
jgi:SAM-dependent methyltransferase